jgi:hypothetical protein
MKFPKIYKSKNKEKYFSNSEVMFPTHYQKMPIKYDPFSKMFHNNIKNLEKNFENSYCNTIEMERFGLTKKTNQYQTDSQIDINESVIINDNEKNDNNRISNFQIKTLINTGYNNNYGNTNYNKDNNSNRNVYNSNQKENFNNNKDKDKDNNNIYQITSSQLNSNFNSYNRNKKRNFNIDEKKTYYDKNYLFQDYKNEENDIVSNFNIHKDVKYNQLIYTNKFSDFNCNYKKYEGFNNYINNKFEGIAAGNISNYNNEDSSSIYNIDGKKSNIHKLSTIGNKEKSPFVDLKEDKTIKNSFYYSLRERLKKNSIINNININCGQGNILMSNVNLSNLNTINNFNNFNNKNLNSRENTLNKIVLGNSFTNISNANANLNINSNLNGNNNNIELSIDEVNSYKEINPHAQLNYFSVHNKNFSIDNSINDISAYRKNNETNKNNLLNKESPLINRNFDKNKVGNGREFFKNFNLINKKNNLNSYFISKSVNPKKGIASVIKYYNYFNFPKLKKPKHDDIDNVLKGIYNVIEIKSKFKKIKR